MIPREDERSKTIFLKPRFQMHEEGQAKDSEDIKPGMLIEIDGSSTDLPRSLPIVKKSTANGTKCRLLICKEAFLQGLGIGDVIPDGDVVPFAEAMPGEVFLVRVPADYAAVPGAKLSSVGDGTFDDAGSDVPLVEVEDTIDWDVQLAALADLVSSSPTDPRVQPLVRVKAL